MNQPTNDQLDDTDTNLDLEADETQESIARQLVDILCEDKVPKAFKKGKASSGKKVATAPGSVKYGKK